MTTTTAAGEVNRYLDEVRALLVDLAEDERNELLDDLAIHLREVAAETDEPLERAVGSPAAFASELRSSAGLTGGAHTGGPGPVAAARQRLERGRRLVSESGPYRWTRALLPELVPGWWVLRGYLVVVVLSVMGGDHHFPHFPVPALLGSALLGLVAVAVAIFASVSLGRRHRGEHRARWVNVLDVLVVIGTLSAAGAIRQHVGPQYVFSEAAPMSAGPLSHADGRPITNLFAYDEAGQLLDGVLLYDQDGRPVVVGDGDLYSDSGLPLETEYRLDANGAEIPNLYPLDQRVQEWRYQPDGSESTLEAQPVRPPAIAPPRLAESQQQTTTTVSTSSTTALPTTTVP
ncbi:MAG TPA: hypothetical protein VGR26_02965 [Acidimicrobiales bacterium]|nr:hypothetical protein [Acidimicrobiales bacterium]